jgi:hypothetical protein
MKNAPSSVPHRFPERFTHLFSDRSMNRFIAREVKRIYAMRFVAKLGSAQTVNR